MLDNGFPEGLFVPFQPMLCIVSFTLMSAHPISTRAVAIVRGFLVPLRARTSLYNMRNGALCKVLLTVTGSASCSCNSRGACAAGMGNQPVVWCGVVWCGVVCRRRCYQKAMAGMSTHGYR